MRAPEGLDDVAWPTLQHAYGPAGDVPDMIRALYAEESPETADGEYVVEELINNLNHQGSLYPATLEAVPFLAHLALHVVITGDPRPVLPLLLARAAPGVIYAPNDNGWYDRRDALCGLADMRTAGALPATPPELRPLLELCAASPLRVTWMDDYELRGLARALLYEPMPS